MSPPPLSTESPTSPTDGASHSQSALSSIPGKNPSHRHHPAVHSFYSIFGLRNRSDNFIHAFSGATAGFASGIFTCPLDVIKTKLQAQGGFLRQARQGGIVGSGLVYRGFTGTAKVIWKEEGVRGMYRGLTPIILGYLPTWAVYFTVYEKCKTLFARTEIKHQWVSHILSAMIAGGSSTLCTNPIWVIKTRLMSQASQYPPGAGSTNSGPRAPWHYKGTIDAARKMYAHEGIGAFYSGLGPALLGLTHVAVQFPLYEQFKRLFVRKNPRHLATSKSGDEPDVDFLGILAASCLSKICASSATYPHEVLRTRMQTQYRPNAKNGVVDHSNVGRGGAFVSTDGGMPGVKHATTLSGLSKVLTPGAEGAEGKVIPRYVGIINSARMIYREEGWRAFYAGMGTNMIRAVPASAMTLLTYEVCSTYLMKYKHASQYGSTGSA